MEPSELANSYKGSVGKEAVFPKAEYEERLKKVRTAMVEKGLDFIISRNMPSICWISGHQSTMAERYNCLIVPARGALTLQTTDIALGVVNSHTVENFRWVRWDLMSSEGPRQLVNLLQDYGADGKRIGIEMWRPGLDIFTFTELKRAFPRADFVDASDLVLKLRAVKSPAEIACMRKAAKMTDAGINAALEAVKPGATENTVAAAAYGGMIAAGSEFISLQPQICAGTRGAMAHATFQGNRLNIGEPIIIEMGAVSGRYSAPIFRTGVIKTVSDKLRRLTDASLETLEILYADIKPGRTVDEVSRSASERLKKMTKSDPDAEFNQQHAYAVGLGFPPDWTEHSIYIRPRSTEVLKPGMTFHAIRVLRVPHLMCVGFSETILVTESGCEPLTSYPRQLYVG